MIDKSCIVCGDFPALHKVTITEDNKITTHYLCSMHAKEVQDPKRFFSLLEEIPIPEEHFYDLSEFLID